MKFPEYSPLLKNECADTALPFRIHSIRSTRADITAHNMIAHKQHYVEIIWIIKGSGTLVMDLEKYTLQDNSIFCITPGQLHQLQLTDEQIEGYVISFTEAFLHMGEQEFDLMYNSGLFQSFSRSAGIRLDIDIAGEMQEIALKMLKESNNAYLFKTEMLRRYLKIFLIYVARQFQGPLQTLMQTRNLELTEKFKSLVEQHFKTHRKVADYAKLLAVTPNYLNEIIKKTTAYPASHHIRQRIILEAKRRVAYSDECMKEVAWHLGFSDIAHFSKFFKNATGTTFTEFRKECLVLTTG
ncbi:helix-turn-helix transcriptional regulator [Chitinophaga filiformis]|uniref:AraC family transcriptional regulator n=1 Tax=Chitinophaga filiformis TaxID=104663 RepID=UPI001F275DF6|nr:helix-turn-helix transcriptional regulator [Chitinophaga filiformis]MCF6404538.1 helix-turn-helix transcriptional regulator [Chitinophaga filiformis]